MRSCFQVWVNAVCQEVRFRPDRRSIEFELRDHYEDHVRDLVRLGRSREIAEQRALEAMGNAQEVGWALDKIHKPWLGWLWEVSRFLVLALALLLAWKVWNWDTYSRFLLRATQDQLAWSVPSSAVSHASTDYLELWLAPGEIEVYQDPYEEAPVPGETRVQVFLTLWAETRDVFHTDLAGLYDTPLNVAVDGRPLPRWEDLPFDSQPDSGYWSFYGWDDAQNGWTRYRNNLRLVLDSPPRRVEITHPRAGWTLRAKWEGAA